MRNFLLIVGNDLKLGSEFTAHLLKLYIKKFGEIDEIKFIEKNNTFLPEIIKDITKEKTNLTIFASSQSYHVVSKIIATLSGDLLELKEFANLTPSRASVVEDGSFLIRLNGSNINLLKTDPLGEIPPFLIKPIKNFSDFYVFDYEIDELRQTLNPLATTYNVSLVFSKFSAFLTLVRVYQNEYADGSEFIKQAKFRLNSQIITQKNFIAFIANKLKLNNAKITFAESCTGGMAAARLCDISGASDVFDGSVVTYANEIKHLWLNVSQNTLDSYGAVSKECVEEMLRGALTLSGASFALAISGVAGPTGGSASKPVGTVFIGVAQNGSDSIVRRFHISGDRTSVRIESVNIAFSLLLMLRGDLFFD
ncbi:MAG: CinA family protein [Campylobacter sp.]|nr:CinA family protein [Campylobacter sp.]